MKKKRQAHSFRVYLDAEGDVCIDSENPYNEDARVFLAPDQIDNLIQWLQEVKKEAEQGSRGNAGNAQPLRQPPSPSKN